MADEKNHDETQTPDPQHEGATREYGVPGADADPTRALETGDDPTRAYGAAAPDAASEGAAHQEPPVETTPVVGSAPDAASGAQPPMPPVQPPMAPASMPAAGGPAPAPGGYGGHRPPPGGFPPAPPAGPGGPVPPRGPDPAWAGARTSTAVKERPTGWYQEPTAELTRESNGRGLRITVILVAAFTVLAVLAGATVVTVLGALTRHSEDTVALPADMTSLRIELNENISLNVYPYQEAPAQATTRAFGFGDAAETVPMTVGSDGDTTVLTLGDADREADRDHARRVGDYTRNVGVQLPREVLRGLDLSIGDGASSVSVTGDGFGDVSLGEATWGLDLSGSSDSLTVEAPASSVSLDEYSVAGTMEVTGATVDADLSDMGFPTGPLEITGRDRVDLTLPRVVDTEVFAIEQSNRFRFEDSRQNRSDGAVPEEGTIVQIVLTGDVIDVDDADVEEPGDAGYGEDSDGRGGPPFDEGDGEEYGGSTTDD